MAESASLLVQCYARVRDLFGTSTVGLSTLVRKNAEHEHSSLDQLPLLYAPPAQEHSYVIDWIRFELLRAYLV